MDEIQGIKLQNSLGRLEENYRPDMNMSGYMGVARVLKVHHKSGTADVVLTNSKDTYTSTENNEGKFSARILQRGSNYDDQRGRYWGTIDPVAEGSLVLIAFLDTMKHRPVILGCFHRPDSEDNPYPEEYPLREKAAGYQRREALKRLQINPSLTYRKLDGEGNYEATLGSKSFLAIYNTSADSQGNLNDNHGGFDHHDLSEIDKRTGEVFEADWDEAKSPSKLLFVHRDHNSPERTKIYLSEKGKTRLTRDNHDGKLSYVELSETGKVLFRRQDDSPEHGEGETYSEVILKESGELAMRRSIGGKVTEYTLTEEGNAKIQHHSGSYLEFSDGGEITLKTTKFNIIEG